MWRRCELVHSRFPNPLSVTLPYKVYCVVVMYESANRVFSPIKNKFIERFNQFRALFRVSEKQN